MNSGEQLQRYYEVSCRAQNTFFLLSHREGSWKWCIQRETNNVKWPFYSFSLPHIVYWLTRWKEEFKGWPDIVVAYMVYGARIFTHDFISRLNPSWTNILLFPTQVGNSKCVWTFARLFQCFLPYKLALWWRTLDVLYEVSLWNMRVGVI